MDSLRWQRIQSLFHSVADLPSGQQRAALEQECGGDETLIEDVLALLGEDARGSSLLDRDVASVADKILGDSMFPAAASDFGPYRIRKLLGQGGMGVVYLAERKDLGSLVAIKVLRDAWVSPLRRERFNAEQRTLAQLNHPLIARLYDADSLPDGTPWFVMEYVDGVPLTDYCTANRSPIASRLRLLRSICEAVRFAHAQAVIHRDLKPSNVLVKRDGSVRLLDFGIAKQLENAERPMDPTLTGMRLMTPAYAAPEQVRGERVGIQADVYSLGVMLYELLSGRLPFDLSRRTPAEAETLIARSEAAKPSTVGGRWEKAGWDDLDVLCLTAMHRDVARRYASVEALMRDIDHYLAGEPLDARPDDMRYRVGKFVGRNRRAVSAVSAMIAGGIGMATFFTLRLAKARNSALAEAARTQRIQRFMANLFEGGDHSVGPSDGMRVITLIERGVQEAKSLDGEPDLQAELYVTLGGLYQKLGKLEEAETLLTRALSQRERLFGSDHVQFADGLIALGMLRVAQARFEEAEKLMRRALEISRRTLAPQHPMLARATAAVGRVLEDRGRYADAIPLLEEAVRLYSAAGSRSVELAESLTELANSHFYSGHYGVADELNRRVLQLDREIHGERHPHVADDLINLGAIQFEWGRYREAEDFYRQALDLIAGWYGNQHQETASALTMLGRALIPQGRANDAAEMLRSAVAIQERVYGRVHPRVASTLNELGHVALQGGKLDEAEALFRRMAEIYREVYHDRHYLIGIALSNLAAVLLQRGELKPAEDMLLEVIERYRVTLAPDHLNTGIAYIKLGRPQLLQKHYADAERSLLQGYAILKRQPSPPKRWLNQAGEDLAVLYRELNQPEKAMEFAALASS